MSHGGWCPRQRRAEDGVIPPQYVLRETPSTHYAQRTEWNVRDSDATVIFSVGPHVSGGTRLTLALARRQGKPVLHLSRQEALESGGSVVSASARLKTFLDEYRVRRLNVAGPRASQEPEIGAFVRAVFEQAFGD